VKKSSHRSRKKQAKRRREEQEIAKREAALADGTADDNPETAADFERLLAGNPNSSEIWIRYMSFHLALADVQAAREVAMRAFGRIEFRQEQEKLNVWCALLTLELRFGSAETFQGTIDRACQHNNPKQVYLRACEIIEKEHAPNPSPSLAQRADDLFAKMCKKFKDKKKVWIAYMEHLLKSGRFEEAHALSKRAMLSLPSYKHVETMSKFAQLVFEYGSAERARTLFDGLLLRYPKRLDLLFVYADKEVKHGDVEVARSLFARVANPHDQTLKMKLSDKQMKSFFKKWFTFEEIHGTEETQERVKDAARAFVEQTTTALK
jgi:rRNA biogenesis protein RRP5